MKVTCWTQLYPHGLAGGDGKPCLQWILIGDAPDGSWQKMAIADWPSLTAERAEDLFCALYDLTKEKDRIIL